MQDVYTTSYYCRLKDESTTNYYRLLDISATSSSRMQDVYTNSSRLQDITTLQMFIKVAHYNPRRKFTQVAQSNSRWMFTQEAQDSMGDEVETMGEEGKKKKVITEVSSPAFSMPDLITPHCTCCTHCHYYVYTCVDNISSVVVILCFLQAALHPILMVTGSCWRRC